MKTCTKCLETKDFSSFCKDKRRKNGIGSHCKKCSNFDSRIRHHKNLQKERLRNKKYREANGEKVAARHKRNKEANPNYQKQYRQNNKEKRRFLESKRQIQKLGNGVFKVRPKFIKKLYTSSCFYCGSKQDIQQDHVLPITKGGPHKEGNLVPACKKCNISKKDKLLIVWKIQKQKQLNANVLVDN